MDQKSDTGSRENEIRQKMSLSVACSEIFGNALVYETQRIASTATNAPLGVIFRVP